MSSFDSNGNYNKTNWKTGDELTADKLNKIEDAVEIINNNDIERHKETDGRLDKLEGKNKTIEEEVNNKANKEHTHDEYLTEHQPLEEYAKKDELFSKDYNDLTNKPIIPSIDGLATENYVDSKIEEIDVTNQLTDYAKKTEMPTKISQLENDKNYLTEIPSEYITETELNNKGYLTEHIDISGKVDKINGKGLSTNDYTTEEKNKLNNIEENANNYTHPTTHKANIITQDTTHRFVSDEEKNNWNNKSNFSGNYNDLTNKPTIPTITNDLTNALKTNYDVAYNHSQVAHSPSNAQKNSDITKAEIEAKLTGNITSHTHNQYLTEHQPLEEYAKKDELFSKDYNDLTNKPIIPSIDGLATVEYVKSEIGKIDVSVDIVDSVEEMTDINNQYVHSGTNTWWKYKTFTIPAGSVLSNVDNAIKWNSTQVVLNKRINSSYNEVDAPGCATFYFTFDSKMQNILNTIDPVWIRMKGCSMYITSGNTTSTKFSGWNSTGTPCMNAVPSSQILMYEETKDGISNTPYPSATFKYIDNKTAPVTATKFGYMNETTDDNSTNSKRAKYMEVIDGKLALSLIVNFANQTPITEEDLEDVYITFNEPIISYEEITVGDWVDTGIKYNAGDGSSILELNERVADLEDRVEVLESKPGGGTSTESSTSNLPDYWKNRLDEIGTKIETLQKENGMDTLQFLWCSDIHGVPGTSPSNTTYIGEIGRYLMDKHNIPFFIISGDIMSQASHANTNSVWSEYDNLNSMLASIKNEELLAIRGNHDGVWGSPMDYNGQANQYYHSYISDKALFNAFMRRQTLDRYKRVFGKDGMYFYVDYHDYRIYMLNGHTFGDNSVNAQGQAVYNGFKHPVLGSEQIQWVANTLNDVKENQQVVFVCHAQLNQELDYEVFKTMLQHYITRTSGNASKAISGTYWGTDAKYAKSEVSFDFTKAKGSILGWFNGHIHSDSIKTDLFDILPIFTITTAGGDVRDTYYSDGTLTRTKNSPTETAIDIVTITSEYVYFTRIGSGYDRKYNILTKETTIVKGDTPSEDGTDEPEVPELTQGEITSEVTWQMNTRLSSSSGNYSSQNGIASSSDIPVKKGDVIRVYNYITSLGRNYSYVNTYSSSNFLSSMDFTSDNSQTTNYADATIDATTGLLTVTIKHDTVSYIRVATLCSDSSRFKISRNKELEIGTDEPEVPELTQGEITNNVTWEKDKRLSSSSGNYSGLTGSYASSNITCKNGDVIRLYNVSKGTNYNYVVAYGSAFLGFIDVTNDSEVYSNNYVTATRDNGVTTITILHDSVTYVRVCSNGGIDPSTVRVTINMTL